MDQDQITKFFAADNGAYTFARWNRPISPVVFGVDDASIPVLKGAIEAVARLAAIGTEEMDPELGSNLMMFFVQDWSELSETRDLDKLVPELAQVVDRLKAVDASQYRFFRFDEAGGIKAAFSFIRMTGAMAELPAETLALTQAVQLTLTWGPEAFGETSPLALHPETKAVILRPEISAVIQAAYDPVMPICADDPSHALRLSARLSQ